MVMATFVRCFFCGDNSVLTRQNSGLLGAPRERPAMHLAMKLSEGDWTFRAMAGCIVAERVANNYTHEQ
jgi:hypothetical protein